MVSYLPPLYNLSIYNRSFYDYQDGSASLASTDARYLKKAIADTSTSSQLSLNNSALLLGNSSSTSSNTINGVAITLGTALSAGNVLINRPIAIGYEATSSGSNLMGYSLSTATTTPIALTTSLLTLIGSQAIVAGNWIISVQFIIKATAGGNINDGFLGVSSSAVAFNPFTLQSYQQFHNNNNLSTNEESHIVITFPVQITGSASQTMHFYALLAFPTGAYSISHNSYIMRVA